VTKQPPGNHSRNAKKERDEKSTVATFYAIGERIWYRRNRPGLELETLSRLSLFRRRPRRRQEALTCAGCSGRETETVSRRYRYAAIYLVHHPYLVVGLPSVVAYGHIGRIKRAVSSFRA
jgi:hypothetical protein